MARMLRVLRVIRVIRVLAAVTAATTLLLGLGVLSAGDASAHDVLISTEPAVGSTVPAAPALVRMTFDKPVLGLGTEIQVTGPGGELVSAGKPRLVDSDVEEDLGGTLPSGRYTVLWRVTSADGHPVSGRFAFTATAGGRGAAASAPVAAPAATGAGAGTGSGDAGVSGVLIGGVAALVVLLALIAGGASWVRRRR